jgi:predicted transcriptional regulator
MEHAGLTEMTALIVASFVSHNPASVADVPMLIASTYAALVTIHSNSHSQAAPGRTVEAVPIEESITHDYLICLEDGKKLRSLKRYLRTKYGLSPEEYRTRWGLPADYPMVAPAYSALRSEIAKRGPPERTA